MLHHERRGAVSHLRMDRPERRNAVDIGTLVELQAALDDAAEQRDRVVVLSGTAPAFCSGADLSGVEDGVFVETLGRVLRSFGSLDAITIAAVDGPALGAGMQLASACDLRTATASSQFGVPAAKLGIAVDRWTVERVVSEAGSGVARGMFLAAQTYSGETLCGAGFVHRIADIDGALEWAEVLAGYAPLTIAAHKQAIEAAASGRGLDAVDHVALAATVEQARVAAWRSEDAAEGVAAFREKRPPRFLGR